MERCASFAKAKGRGFSELGSKGLGKLELIESVPQTLQEAESL